MTAATHTVESKHPVAEEVLHTLNLLFSPDDVVELRILNTRRQTVSGYFNDLGKLAAAAVEWDGSASAVYVTINPVNPSLLARASNRAIEYAKNTTSDPDIVCRRWLPIDVDPARPAGISSTDEEHERAISTAKLIARFLLDLGISKDSIVLSDSGNGAHVLVRIDLPNDKESAELVQRCLEAVALRYGDGQSLIDLKVYNAARIWKLYGTKSCKGDNTRDRPHRVSRVLWNPKTIEIAPRVAIEKLASLAPEKPQPDSNGSAHGFSLDNWITERLPGAIGPHTWNGGRKWLLDVCPWNPDHTNRSAYIVQHAGGGIGAGCHHNGCVGKGWHELRDVFEPGWRERKPDTYQRHSVTGGSNPQGGTPDQVAKHNFTLVSAKEVLAAEDVETSWIWDGILPTGGMSLVVAKPKVGKTTLAFDLAVSVARGSEFLNRKTEQGSVVYLALEEKKGEIKKKLKSAAISDEPLVFHFGSAPLDALKQVEPLIVETRAKLLIIDVLQKFCRLRDLNDYAQVTNTLEPLMSAARKQGCHILLTHHAGKADRPDGDDILGSTGLLGGVDTSIHIKKRDKRRTFFTIQRYGEDTPETVIQLTEAGSLESIGSREEVEVEETEPLILAALKDGELLAVNDLCEMVEKRKTLILRALGLLIETGQLTKSGSGKKGDPYKYSVLVFPNTNGNSKTEFKSADNQGESKEKCCSGVFSKNEKAGNGMGTAFSEPKIGQKNAQEPAPNGGQKEAPFSAEDWQEEERYIRDERAAIRDEDDFEDVRK